MSTRAQQQSYSSRQQPDGAARGAYGPFRYLVVIWSDEPEVRIEDACDPGLRRAAAKAARTSTAA